MFSSRTYFTIQAVYLVPAVLRVWKDHQADLIKIRITLIDLLIYMYFLCYRYSTPKF